MTSNLKATRWLTAQTLHQIQILSCDLCDFVTWEAHDHAAPFWRLYWHDKAGAEIVLNTGSIQIRPGQLVLIPPNTHFASRIYNPVRQFFLHFLVEPRFHVASGSIFQVRASEAQRDICARIIRELQSDTSSIAASLLSQQLVASALLELPREQWSPCFEDARITRAVETITKSYPARVENRTLAEAAAMHPTAFIRLFRQCTGHTPLHYLTNLRLEEACSLLHYDDASLDEIAAKTGFGERGYFTRVFSRTMNCSPARYRKLVNVSNRLRPKG